MTLRSLIAALALALVTAASAEEPRDPGGPGFDPVYEPPDTSLFGTSVPLVFSVDEGLIQNRFYRRGPVAAHLLVRSGAAPRLIVAFPAENEGAALWFETAGAAEADMTVLGPIDGIWAEDEPWGVYGFIQAETDKLRIRGHVLGSVRAIREVEHGGGDGLAVQADLHTSRGRLELTRTLADGRRLVLRLEPVGDARIRGKAGPLSVVGTSPIRFKVTALTEAEPLLPIPSRDILQSWVDPEPEDLQALAFLTYREKLLAGSWRFLTYFGRDTLLSTMLMMPALEPEVVEAALGSVLDRMGPDGDVAHEEDIGDWAALRGDGAATYDYSMVDDDFMVAPVLAHYLMFTEGGQHGAEAFLQRQGPGGTYREIVRRNLVRVMDLAEPYAAHPAPENLIALRADAKTGEWRDSMDGLGGGRIPYSVNVALVPAALRAAEELLAGPLLGPDPEGAARAHRLAGAWSDTAEHFQVEIPVGTARGRVEAFGAKHGLDATAALASIEGQVSFPAVALHADGAPVEVMHSDDGFVLLFGRPDAAELDRIAGRLLRPFPAGLLTPAGVVVANPAFASDPALAARFTRDHYHGAVVWSWQQAMLADGLAWQLLRDDLPAATRANLGDAQAALWEAIEATAQLRRSELWSWDVVDGELVPTPFGQGADHHSESNAVQLWSTVFIAVRPPGS